MTTSTGLLLVISGPSGVGKTTIARAVRDRFEGVFSISATTRPKSDRETNGKDYWFVTQEKFDQMLGEDNFLEHALVFGTHAYGTPREPVQENLDEGKLVVLDIDVQGALQVREAMPTAYMVFVLPPSEDELHRRLEARGRDDEEAIHRRFAEAKREISLATESGVYDEFVVNDDLHAAIETACRFVHRRWHGAAEA